VLRLAADEDFNRKILRGLVHRLPDLDIESVQEAGLAGADDPTVLQWAADADRVLLTHDAKTMPTFAYQRLAAGQKLVGLIVVGRQTSIGPAIDRLEPLIAPAEPGEYEGRVVHLRF
jgi:hypothetical protein